MKIFGAHNKGGSGIPPPLLELILGFHKTLGWDHKPHWAPLLTEDLNRQSKEINSLNTFSGVRFVNLFVCVYVLRRHIHWGGNITPISTKTKTKSLDRIGDMWSEPLHPFSDFNDFSGLGTTSW